MDLLPAFTAAPLVILLLLARRHTRRRRPLRLDSALAQVEAASALVIADWPPAHTAALLELLAQERRQRSASYRQGWHTATGRERDYLVLQRIEHAEERLRVARELASRAAVRSAERH